MRRIRDVCGDVVFWDCARVLGVLAMSRAIGDKGLRPFVIPEPEVTVHDRCRDDMCLLLVSERACSVARASLRGRLPLSSMAEIERVRGAGGCAGTDKPCLDAAVVLSEVALGKHSGDNISIIVTDVRRRPSR